MSNDIDPRHAWDVGFFAGQNNNCATVDLSTLKLEDHERLVLIEMQDLYRRYRESCKSAGPESYEARDRLNRVRGMKEALDAPMGRNCTILFEKVNKAWVEAGNKLDKYGSAPNSALPEVWRQSQDWQALLY